MKTFQIRKLFLDYFESKDHIIVPSSSLLPQDDPSLLFTNSGMVQFKKFFLGQEEPNYRCATSCQRCLRAGGKHNDLENVGFTSRHHTFFEMLGNFSFGGYFKKDAILYAWDFIINYLKIPPEKLWVTVFIDDLETENIWLKELKIDPNRFSKCNAQENFWSMGDTGPCGPCTEIYYDHGAEFIGNPPGFGDPGDRYVEIYNLVFMQYNRSLNGELLLLPKPCVDTGMGLERVAAIMQSVHSNYEIDLFIQLITDLAKLLNYLDLNNPSLKVIADHLRACCFLIFDGVYPSNEGRGYVLRRIIRRAIRHGYKLGKNEPFLNLLITNTINAMGVGFEFLREKKEYIQQVLLNEELQFSKTLDYGMKLLQQEIAKITNIDPDQANNLGNYDYKISGEVVFKLYDTYGFPLDLTMDVAREHGITLDLNGFEKKMQEQKQRAQKMSKFKDLEDLNIASTIPTKFVGYEHNKFVDAEVLQIFDQKNNQPLEKLTVGEEAKIVLSTTPFYAESGGQVGDTGILFNKQGINFAVTNTQIFAKRIIHIGQLKAGTITKGDSLTAQIDLDRRQKIKCNHSATHLLHAALRTILGQHVKQKGSVVDDKRLRFDFEHTSSLSDDNITAVENLVNSKIRANLITKTAIMSVEDAINSGAIALFNEKYQDQVRVLNIADHFSLELCGGTHVSSTGEIGCFKIIKEEAISSGVRRIEAITGQEMLMYVNNNQNVINKILKLLKVSDPNQIVHNINKILQKSKDLEKNLDLVEQKLILEQSKDLAKKAQEINKEIKILISETAINPKYLKIMVDHLKNLLNKAVVILGCKYNASAIIIVGVTKDLTQISALNIIKKMAVIIDGKGGGRNDLAEARGIKQTELLVALKVGEQEVKSQLTDL